MATIFWKALRGLIQVAADPAIKIYLLHRVLSFLESPVSGFVMVASSTEYLVHGLNLLVRALGVDFVLAVGDLARGMGEGVGAALLGLSEILWSNNMQMEPVGCRRGPLDHHSLTDSASVLGTPPECSPAHRPRLQWTTC